MDKTAIDERRAHKRHPTSLSIQGTPDQGGVVARMVAHNLSVGGLYCVSTTDFPEMTRLEVRLMLPLNGSGESADEPLKVEAVVVRRQALPSSNGQQRFELALYFNNLPAMTRARIEHYLSRTD